MQLQLIQQGRWIHKPLGGQEARVKGGGGSGAPYGEQTSVAAGGRAMSDFSESEGANADVIERRRPGGHGGRAECSV